MRLALAQMSVVDDLRTNLETILKLVKAASTRGADIALFPECALTGYLGISRSSLAELEPLEVHVALERVGSAAAEHGVAVVMGQYFKRCGAWFNNAVFFDRSGKLRTSYDKCHLVDEDCYHVAPGLARPEVVDFEGTRVSLGICHDLRYPEHVRCAAMQGSQVHLHCFYGIRHVRDLRDQEVYDAHLCTRASENGLFLAATNASAHEQMVRSQVRNPEGRLVLRAESWSDELMLCDIDPSTAREGWVSRRRDDLYPLGSSPAPATYFERGVWQTQPYMIRHDRNLLSIPPRKESA